MVATLYNGPANKEWARLFSGASMRFYQMIESVENRELKSALLAIGV